MRAVAYARRSRYKGGGLSPSIPIQVEESVDYIGEQGWEHVGTFYDDDVSASRFTDKPREDYNRMLKLIEDGAVDVIVMTEMSRLYRRPSDLEDVFSLAERTPLRKIATTENISYELGTPEGIHNARNAVASAELESNRLSVRARRRKRAQARQGQYAGGRRPFGYDHIPSKKNSQGEVIEPGRLIPNRREAAVVRWCAIRILHGDSVRYCARILNEKGIRTTEGKLWRPSNLKRVLTGKHIIGIRVHNTYDNKGRITGSVDYKAAWPPIMQLETWERLNRILNDESRFVGAEAKGNRSYLLSGFATCGRKGCGRHLVGMGSGSHTGKQYRRYACRKFDETGRQRGCGSVHRMAEPVDEFVRQSIMATINLEKLARIIAAQQEDSEVKDLLKAQAEERTALLRAAMAHAKGLYDDPTYLAVRAEIEARRDAIERKLDQHKSVNQSARILASIRPGQTLEEAWDENDLDWRRNLITAVISEIRILPVGPGQRQWITDRGTWRFDPKRVKIKWRV